MITEQKYAIIVAGGSGKRMGTNTPKQFLRVAKTPILMHTIKKFHLYDASIKIIVVLPSTQIKTWKALIKEFEFNIPHIIEKGGPERFYSVKNGLEHISSGLVAIHDGVRPLVSMQTISNCFYNAAKFGAAIPVVKATESIRKTDGKKSVAVNRSLYCMVQTPQVFKANLLIDAYNQSFTSTFTDDASVVEKTGQQIYLCQGNPENIKITQPMDITIAEALLSKLD